MQLTVNLIWGIVVSVPPQQPIAKLEVNAAQKLVNAGNQRLKILTIAYCKNNSKENCKIQTVNKNIFLVRKEILKAYLATTKSLSNIITGSPKIMASLNWRSINYHCNKRRNSNEKVFAKSLLVAAMFSVAGSALAVQKDITVTANVDAALDMTQTDNTALPKAVEMQYLPGQGLQSYQLMTKIWSNDVTKDVKMQLVSPAQLVQSTDASKIVPLTVTWGGEEIKADAATTFTATKIFASDALTNGSLAKNLMFAQTTKGVLETGIYRGVVSIYLSQDI